MSEVVQRDGRAMGGADQPDQRAASPSPASDGLERGDEATTDERGTTNALVILCPYCKSPDVELLALFGAQLLTDQYYCNACHTPFEHVRDT